MTKLNAAITVNKNRVKIHEQERFSNDLKGKSYLQDQQEYEVEIFNGESQDVLVKISIDGEPIGSGGVVLRPGERAFIERWLDNPRRFMFSTYQVEDSSEAKAAIRDNGIVTVEFYREQRSVPKTFFTTNLINDGSWTGSPTYGDTFTTSTGGVTLDNMSFMSQASTNSDLDAVTRGIAGSSSKSIETGKTEEGSHSNQEFKTVYGKSWDWFYAQRYEFKLLPVSQQPVYASEVKVQYCTNCGAKLKKGWKFCAKCGQKV